MRPTRRVSVSPVTAEQIAGRGPGRAGQIAALDLIRHDAWDVQEAQQVLDRAWRDLRVGVLAGMETADLTWDQIGSIFDVTAGQAEELFSEGSGS